MQSMKLLIIDDDYQGLLEKCRNGFPDMEIRTAAGAAEGLRCLEREDIQIILLDIILPDGSGYKLCRDIRKSYYLKPIQIILISGQVEDKSLRQTLEVGGDDFIKKPILELELQTRLQAALIRLKAQQAVFQEREFYRQAARQEEELSARILDQNLLLKRAYQSIESMRRELEESNQELLKLARFDSLSGLLNRNCLFNMLDIEIERTLRSNLELSGIMIDIDHFKVINDNFGHQCGDTVIEAVGKCLRERLRKYDLAGRYGGEEFFVALPDTSLERASSIARRFLNDLRSLRLSWQDNEILLTASLGVAGYRRNDSRDLWIARADRAMYAAKEKGRNMVLTA